MTTFIISGSFDRNLGPIPLGSYKAAVYGSISIDDAGRNPIASENIFSYVTEFTWDEEA